MLTQKYFDFKQLKPQQTGIFPPLSKYYLLPLPSQINERFHTENKMKKILNNRTPRDGK
mgnify:CR=1